MDAKRLYFQSNVLQILIRLVLIQISKFLHLDFLIIGNLHIVQYKHRIQPAQMLKLFVAMALLATVSAYIELELSRIPPRSSKASLAKTECQDPKTISNQTKYLELCYEKDMAYTAEFQRPNAAKYQLALDLTAPVSWIKGDNCKIVSTSLKCSLFRQTLNQKLQAAIRHKVTQLIQKLKMKIVEDQSDSAVIQGSNEIVTGSVQKVGNLSVLARNTDHVSHFLDVVMLGLFIIGEKDNITLNETTFIRAHQISPNLDSLCDGALSLRFDDNSENSFLGEVFKYLGSPQKVISVYLGERARVATIGSYSPKYLQGGIASLRRLRIQQDQQFGKLPRMQAIILQDKDKEINTIDALTSVVFTLAASYVALPHDTIAAFISKFITHHNTCKPEAFLQCTFSSKAALQRFLAYSLNFDFQTSIVSLQMKDLVVHSEGKKATFNIRDSQSNFTILGEPFFMKYYAYFDYGKNEIGFGERALSIEQSLVQTVTLIHCVVLLILFLICMALSSEKCRGVCYLSLVGVAGKMEPGWNKLGNSYRPLGKEGKDGKESKDGKEARGGNGSTLDEQI